MEVFQNPACFYHSFLHRKPLGVSLIMHQEGIQDFGKRQRDSTYDFDTSWDYG